MSPRELDLLRSEVVTLESLLHDLPEGRVIERLGLEHRLRQARERLAALDEEPWAKRLPITFRGAPVDGMRAIDARFGATALRAFIEATDTVAASLSAEELKGTGPLPGKGPRTLRIVDTAVGSFGFELELPPPVPAPLEGAGLELPPDDTYERAIEATFDLIRDSVSADDGALSEVVAEVHPRAAAKVRAFAKVLADHDARFAAEFEGRRVRLKDADEVKQVVDALAEEDIVQREEHHLGQLLGILPVARSFECRLDDNRVVRGKLARGVDAVSFQAQWEGQRANLAFDVVEVRTKTTLALAGAAPVDAQEDPGEPAE